MSLKQNTFQGGSESTTQDWLSPVAPVAVMCAQVLQDEGLMITMQSRNAVEATKECRNCLSAARPSESLFQSQLVEMGIMTSTKFS